MASRLVGGSVLEGQKRFKGAQTQPCVGHGGGSIRPVTLVAKADFYTSMEGRLVGSGRDLSRRNWLHPRREERVRHTDECLRQ
jgi:hypothetical protein